MASKVKNVDLIFLFMVAFLLVSRPNAPGDRTTTSYCAGLAAMKLQLPTVAPGLLKTQAQPRMLGQPVFLVQKPRQVVVVAACCSWRAETVPAQRTAVTMAPSNEFLMVFVVMIALLRI
jgi:hypothetical protein